MAGFSPETSPGCKHMETNYMPEKGSEPAGKPRVFVIDDDRDVLNTLAEILKPNYEVSLFRDPDTALETISETKPLVVLSDVKIGGKDGIETLKRIKTTSPDIGVIIMSAYTTTTLAVESIQFGASDYISKPFEVEDMIEVVDKVARNASVATDSSINRVMHSSIYSKKSEKLIGTNPLMLNVYKTVGKIADKDSTVLILGESGTGKELIARIISSMNRSRDTMVTINCSAIPENLFESEIFGHEKGAFTGAESRKMGKAEAADGGILFLDEVDMLPLLMQSKILRLIQQKEFQRVGGVKTLTADVRIIAAAKPDIESRVNEGTFREDLYYRLGVVTVHVPPLRERRDDIVALFNYFLTETNRKHGKKIKNVSASLIRKLKQYDWPGNVRELENAVERAVIFAAEGFISEDHFPFLNGDTRVTAEDIRGENIDDMINSILKKMPESEFSQHYGSIYRQFVSVFEKNLFEAVLDRTNGNQAKAAEMLGVSRNTLRERIKRFEIETDS